MSTTFVSEVIAAVLGFVTLLAYIMRVSFQLGALALKVDTMWNFLVNRGKLEAVYKGWGNMQSPFKANEKGLELVLPFLDVFLPLYAKSKAEGKSDEDIMLEFEREHSDLLLQKVCIPNQMQLGACVVLMYEACKIKEQEAKVDGGTRSNS